MPTISIIIPTFNRPRQIAECLRSLAALDFPPERFEVIIVDDGGSAPMQPDAGSLDIKLVRQEHGGAGRARNTGSQAAQGKYLIFLDDDCIPERGWLTALNARLEQNRPEAIAGKTVNGCPENPYDCTSHLLSYSDYDRYTDVAAPVGFLATNNLAMRADLFRAAGGFIPNRILAYEDREFCDRWLGMGYALTYAPEAVVRHCRAMTLRSFCRQHWTYGRMAWHYYHLLQNTEGPHQPRRHTSRFYLDIGRSALHQNGTVHGLSITALLALSQAIAASGFLLERFRLRSKRLNTEELRTSQEEN